MLWTMLSNEPKPRVLMAENGEAAKRLWRILAGWKLERPGSVRELVHMLRGPSFDLIVVGCHFDGSRAIEALKAALFHAPGVPVVCVRAAPFSSPLGEATLAALHAAAEEIGADSFVDVLMFPDDARGDAAVRDSRAARSAAGCR